MKNLVKLVSGVVVHEISRSNALILVPDERLLSKPEDPSWLQKKEKLKDEMNASPCLFRPILNIWHAITATSQETRA